jgi:hypothetical protein
VLGLSICFWYESLFVAISILLILCIKRRFKGMLMTLIGMVVSIAFVWLLLLLLNVDPLKYIVL